MAVWHFADQNPFHHVLSRVLERYLDPLPPTAGAPDAFRFAQPGELLAILASAGATLASERVLRFSMVAPISVEDFWTLRSEMSDKLRTKLPALSKLELAKLKEEVIEGFTKYSSEDGMNIPGEVLIVSGEKKGPSPS
jgi:hypothetical protein